MSVYVRRRSTLRQSFSKLLSMKLLLPVRVDRLKGRYLFRSAVRRVLAYMEWIMEELVVEETTDDVTVNIRMTEEKQKKKKKLLTLKDRSILLVNPSERSSEDKVYIYELIKKLRAFVKYPEDVREKLAAVCFYQYLPADRIIVRRGRKADNLYCIANGEVNLSKVTIDELTGDEKDMDIGTLRAGDMFGEIALLHSIPRTSTVVSKTSVDLILVPQYEFDSILRYVLLKKWHVLRDALVHFNYFKWWSDETARECCILSKLKDFKAGEILLGDGMGMVNYVHFILSGECRLIEHMLVRESSTCRGTRYELYDPNTSDSFQPHHPRKRHAQSLADNDQSSIVTTTLVDVIKAWHEITDVAAMLMQEPSVTSQLRYPDDIQTVFMQVCIFSRGACFGLGENMLHRRIVAITSMRCLLIPRYWLLEQNRANIWGRVKLFIDSKYPTKKQLFDRFIQNRKWIAYKRNLVKNVVKQRGLYRSNTTVHDVPYSIRITEDINT
ncbi:uncharacterized protein LOC116842787 [Odontomachus brunneus]|uniref:uncharacterized protein LOC116842787 n=1 Tax=Odontomachus brunneus TaxID=486640 RepID=UPI0013F1AEF4|nr:uncharacterized protein LOC116842787 [Odontomachus brunneus]